MRKSTFWSTLVLIGALLLSVTACKDYGDEIDKLNKDLADATTKINSIQASIDAGKVIKSVAPVAGGFKITFTDNTSYDIINGVKGDTGAAGATGAKGADGKDGFTPVIGIDAQGFWTVVKTSGGAAERIVPETKASNVPEIGANGNWFINGVDTGKPSKGKDGADGAGTAGKNAYSPKISSTTGNWEIYDDTTQKYVDSGVSAGSNAPKVEVKDGYLYINDVNTKIGTTLFVSEANGTVTMKLPVGDGTYKTITVATVPAGALNGPVTLATITSINAPKVGNEPLVISVKFGYPVALATAWEKERKDWSGVIGGSVLQANGSASFLVNPADVDPAGYSISLETAAGVKSAAKVNQTWKEFKWVENNIYGYNDGFIKTKFAAEGGLYSVALDVTEADYNALTKDGTNPLFENNLGVVIENPNTGYKLRSMYQYAVEIAPAYAAIVPAATSTTAINLSSVLNVGEEYNLFEGFEVTTMGHQVSWLLNPVTGGPCTYIDLYKYDVMFAPAGTTNSNGVNAKYITLTDNGLITANTPAVFKELAKTGTAELKPIELIVRAVDYTGNFHYKKFAIKFNKNPKISVTLPAQTWTLAELKATGTAAEQDKANMAYFDLSTAGFKVLVESYGLTLADFFSAPFPASLTAVWSIPTVTSPSIGTGVAGLGNANFKAIYYKDKFTAATAVADWKGAGVVRDPALFVPGQYKLVFTYTSTAAATAGAEFTYSVNINVVNPTYDFTTMHSALFKGQAIQIYGDAVKHGSVVSDGTSATDPYAGVDVIQYYAQGSNVAGTPPADFAVLYTLAKAYSFPAGVVANNVTFKATNATTGTGGGLHPDPIVEAADRSGAKQGREIAVNIKDIETGFKFNVDVYHAFFGAVANDQVMETITVEMLSEVARGDIKYDNRLGTDDALKTMELTYNQVLDIPLSFLAYVRAYDVHKNDLYAFRPDAMGGRNERIANITVTPTGNNTALIRVIDVNVGAAMEDANNPAVAAVPGSNDFTVNVRVSNAVLTDNVIIPLEVEITDLYNCKLTKTINVTVKKII